VHVAGCKIETFDKKGYEAEMATWRQGDFKINIAKQYGGNPYQRLVDLGKEAQKVGVIKGILLHQGESNNNDREWPNKVKAIYEDLLKDLEEHLRVFLDDCRSEPDDEETPNRPRPTLKGGAA